MEKNVMSARQIREAKRRLQSLQRQMANVGPVMRGTIVTNGRRHPQPYFSLNKDGRTCLIYLGASRVEKARELTENYRKMVTAVEEMTLLNMALLKNNAL